MCFLSACFTNMTHKSLSHFYWCLIWFCTLLHYSQTKVLSKASPWPETEPDADSRVPCGGSVAHHPCTLPLELSSQSNLEMSSLDTAMQQSLPISHSVGDATADQTCGIEELACGLKLPEVSPALGAGNGMECSVLLKNSKRPDSGKPSYRHNSNPLEVMQVQNKLPENGHGLGSDPSLMLPTEIFTAHSGHHKPSIPIGHDAAGVFETELRKGSKPPATGQPSPRHNSFPDSELITTKVDASLKSKGLELLHKEPAGGEIEAAAASGVSDGHAPELASKNSHGGGSFVKIGDSSDLQNILARKPVRPGTGAPSKGHNSVTDGVASE